MTPVLTPVIHPDGCKRRPSLSPIAPRVNPPSRTRAFPRFRTPPPGSDRQRSAPACRSAGPSRQLGGRTYSQRPGPAAHPPSAVPVSSGGGESAATTATIRMYPQAPAVHIRIVALRSARMQTWRGLKRLIASGQTDGGTSRAIACSGSLAGYQPLHPPFPSTATQLLHSSCGSLGLPRCFAPTMRTRPRTHSLGGQWDRRPTAPMPLQRRRPVGPASTFPDGPWRTRAEVATLKMPTRLSATASTSADAVEKHSAFPLSTRALLNVR